MKSNEERVSSIMNKANLYKKKRGEVIASVTTAVCLVVAVLVGVNLSTFHQIDVSGETINGLIADSTPEETLEGELVAFASKEELVEHFEKIAEEYQKNNSRRNYYTFGMVDDAISVDMAVPESAMETDAVGSKATPFATKNASAQAEEEGDYSTTNVQVKGVDEADIIKTDGKKIYYMNSERRKVRIFEEQEGKIKLVKTIELSKENDSYGNAMFLDNQYLVVIATGYERIYEEGEKPQEEGAASFKMAYIPYRSRSLTQIYVYDVNTYELVRKIDTEGNLISSRKIGDNLYLVTNKYLYYYSFYRDDVIPMYKDTLAGDEYCEVAIENVRAFKDFEEENQCNYMIVTSLDLSKPDNKVNIDTYLGAGNEMYCSTNSLYVTKANYHYYSGGILREALVDMDIVPSKDTTTTSIHKFSIKDGKATYIATGEVPGTLLNQFSMDEYDGNFRITTTKEEGNNIYILDKKLNQIGSLENLAKGERIYSTRFMGDKAYVVTYKTVDPLFVIDLSNPSKPTVLGELKIPGYSSYLHPLCDHYLFGFGEDSIEKSYIDWQGNQSVIAYATGLKMAIFDVSDYSNPREVQSVKIGGRGSSSELLYNHKALLLDEAKGVLAFPVRVNQEAGYYSDGTPMYGDLDFEGALVYNFDVEEGFDLKGKITHEAENRYAKYGNIERIIYIGDKFYTVSNGMIKATDRNTMQEVSSLKFE